MIMENLNKRIICVTLVLIALITLASCSFIVPSNIVMPYSCNEYEDGDWTVEGLVAHFKNLGFSNVEVSNMGNSFDKSITEEKVTVYNVTIEDSSSDSWFTEYRDFDKGEEFVSWLKIKIGTHTYIPTLTTNNCSDFAELVQIDDSSPEKSEAKKSFMETHNSEYLEFNGTITDWDDEYFWVGIGFSISVDNSNQTRFSWSTMNFSDLNLKDGYQSDTYKSGLIKAGMRAHMIVQIVSSKDGWNLEIETMEIIQ